MVTSVWSNWNLLIIDENQNSIWIPFSSKQAKTEVKDPGNDCWQGIWEEKFRSGIYVSVIA